MGSFNSANSIGGIAAHTGFKIDTLGVGRASSRSSSGQQINTGEKEDPDPRLVDTLRAKIRRQELATRSANYAISVAQTADRALEQVATLLSRAVVLAKQAETANPEERASLTDQFRHIEGEISHVVADASYDNIGLLTTTGVNGSLTIFVGDVSRAISISSRIATISIRDKSVTDLGGHDLSAISLSTDEDARHAIETFTLALDAVNGSRISIETGIHEVQVAIHDLQSENTHTGEPPIQDASTAEHTAEATRLQILGHSDVAVPAQANSDNQVLADTLSH